jgi:DNA-binding LacI/PurR family transcriptional regulator
MVGYTHDSYQRIKDHVDDFHSRGVDGVICMAYTYPGQYDAIEKLFTGFEHCVFLGSKPFSSGAAYIGLNHHKVCEIAADHLLGHSCKRIALMMPTTLEKYADNFKPFISGYVQAHNNAGVAVDERLYQCMNDIMVVDLPAARRCLKSALSLKPDALIAPSDESAIWYMKALHELGLSVPNDIAMVSLEHWSIGQGITPSLTSIDYQSAELAKEATLMLFGMINNPQAQKPAGKMVDPRLVMGQSCGCNKAATVAES